MAELEALCGRLATCRCTVEELCAPRRRHERSPIWEERNEPDGHYAAFLGFHDAIHRGSHDRCLSDQTKVMRNRLEPYRRFQSRGPRRLASSFAGHGGIMAAIAARDAAGPEELLRAHVIIQVGSVNDFVASLPGGLLRADMSVALSSA